MTNELIMDKKYFNQLDENAKTLYTCILNNCRRSLTETNIQKRVNARDIAEDFVEILNDYYRIHKIKHIIKIEAIDLLEHEATIIQIIVEDKNYNCISYHSIAKDAV